MAGDESDAIEAGKTTREETRGCPWMRHVERPRGGSGVKTGNWLSWKVPGG